MPADHEVRLNLHTGESVRVVGPTRLISALLRLHDEGLRIYLAEDPDGHRPERAADRRFGPRVPAAPRAEPARGQKPKGRFPCPSCGRVFDWAPALASHERNAHERGATPPDPPREPKEEPEPPEPDRRPRPSPENRTGGPEPRVPPLRAGRPRKEEVSVRPVAPSPAAVPPSGIALGVVELRVLNAVRRHFAGEATSRIEATMSRCPPGVVAEWLSALYGRIGVSRPPEGFDPRAKVAWDAEPPEAQAEICRGIHRAVGPK